MWVVFNVAYDFYDVIAVEIVVCWVIWKLLWNFVVRSACGINKLLLNFGILLLSFWKYFFYFFLVQRKSEECWEVVLPCSVIPCAGTSAAGCIVVTEQA